MAGERLLRILDQLRRSEDGEGNGARLCEVSAAVVVVTGAGIMLMDGDSPSGSLCSSNAVSAQLEDLQYTLGEGPCVDAYHEDRPVLEPDLASPRVARWVAFSPPALDAGARAVFGFPIRVGAARVGVLNLYRDDAGPLSDDQHADALVMAEVAGRALLAAQAETPTDMFAAELEAGSDFRFVVHQASGMVAAQLELSVGDALIRLRAYAYANNLLLTDVADGVVARRIRFAPEAAETGSSSH